MKDAPRRSTYARARRRRSRSRPALSLLVCSLVALASVVAAVPLIHSVVPATIPAAALGPDRLPVTLTIHGSGFGASAAELLEVRVRRAGAAPQLSGVALTDAGTAAMLAQSAATLPDSWACLAFQWLDSATAQCTLPSLQLQANFAYTLQLNVSQALSTEAPGGGSASFRVDCLASALCGFCYLDQPAVGEPFYFERQTAGQESEEASILPRRLVLTLLIVGAVCACALLLLLSCCWRRLSRNSGSGSSKVCGGGGKNRVGQRQGAGNLGVIVGSSPSSVPLTPRAPIPVPDGVMISYSHANSDFAHRLEGALTSAGMNVWIDSRIVPGEDWRSNIAEAIELSFAVVFVLSPQSVLSRYCKEEVYFAAQLNRHLVPIVYEDSWKALKGGLKMLLQRIQWLDFARDGWDDCFPRLVSNLQTAHKALQDRAATLAAEDAAARGWSGAASVVGGGDGQRSVTAHHRLRPAQLELEAGGGFAGYDLDYEDPVSFRAAGGGDDATLVMMSPRHSSQTQQQQQQQQQQQPFVNLPVLRSRLPELAGEEVSHEASKSAPADVYICVDGSSRSDQSIAEALRACLVAHGILVYTSAHPKLHVKAIKGARNGQPQHVLINSDGRASPVLVTRPQSAVGGLAALKFVDHRASPEPSRRPSIIAAQNAAAAAASGLAATASPGVDLRSPEPADYPSEFLSPLSAASLGSPDSAPISASGAWGPQHSPDSGGVVSPAPRTLGLHSMRGASVSTAAGATSPPVNPALESAALSSVSHKRAMSLRALLSDGSFADSGPAEDLFELNASHIDASTMMLFIASASSIKSNDCIDEMHYAYEVAKPMLAVLNVPTEQGGEGTTSAAADKWHKGLLHGSVGMMLLQAPSVSWEADGQTTAEWTALFYAVKCKLQAERARKRMESSRRSSGGATLASPAAKAAPASLASADATAAAKQSSQTTQSQSTAQTLSVPPSLDDASSAGPSGSPPTSARGVMLEGVVSPMARRSTGQNHGGVELAALNVTSPNPAVASAGSALSSSSGAFQSPLPRIRSHVSVETQSPPPAADAVSNGDGTMIAAAVLAPSPVYSIGSPPLHPGDPAALLPVPASTSPVAPSGSAVLPMSPPFSASPPVAHATSSSSSSSPQPLHSHPVSPSPPLLPVKHQRTPSSRVPADSPIRQTQQNGAVGVGALSASAPSILGSPVTPATDHHPTPAPPAGPVRLTISGLCPSGPSTPRPHLPAAAFSGSGACSSSPFAAPPKLPTAVTAAATAAASSGRVRIGSSNPPATKRASGTAIATVSLEDCAAATGGAAAAST